MRAIKGTGYHRLGPHNYWELEEDKEGASITDRMRDEKAVSGAQLPGQIRLCLLQSKERLMQQDSQD